MEYSIKIIVATHKKSQMPKDNLYLPLHVGAAGKNNKDGTPVNFGYARDDTGDNISDLNAFFGTQTGLYWIWKNLDADYKGLVHYRRYFTGKKVDKQDIVGSAITVDEIKPMLGKYKVFVPQKRWYIIETLDSHYTHIHDGTHFQVVKKIIENECPEYLTAYNKVLKRRWGYMFNMMILQKDLMNDYCSWLFNILLKAYEQIDTTGLSDYNKRFCGRISEILFDVWLENEIETGVIRKNEVKELPYVEDVDWEYKIKAFLSAKFLGKKYGRSS